MKKEELKKLFMEQLKRDSGRIAAFNNSLEVVELTFSACDDGKLYGWRRFFNFSGDEIEDSSPEVQAFKAWKKEEWNKFVAIANVEGIASALRKTPIV